MALDPYELALRRRLGLPEDDGAGEGTDWLQPIRTLFGATQGVVPRTLSFLFPETYQQAVEEKQAEFGIGPESSVAEQVEAAPGAGDVLAQTVPESVSESLPGRMVGPALRLIGNIAGDPTTYTPFILGKAGKAIAAAAPGGRAALAASALETAVTTEKAAQALEYGQITTGAARAAMQAAHAQEMTRVAAKLAAGSPRAKMAAGAIRAGEIIATAGPYALGSAAAVAYGPGVVQSGLGSLGETYEAVKEGDVEQALVSGANTALMGGLGYLMGRGLISTTKAREVLRKKLVEDGVLPDIDKMVREQAEASGVAPEAQAPFPEPFPGVEGPPTRQGKRPTGFVMREQMDPRVAAQLQAETNRRINQRMSAIAGGAAEPMDVAALQAQVGAPLSARARAVPSLRDTGLTRGQVPLGPDVAAMQAEVGGAPSALGPGGVPARDVRAFRGRVATNEATARAAERILAESEAARARALEARRVQEQQGEGILPEELATAMEERAAGMDLEPPVRFPPPAPQMVIPGMAEPTPPVRPAPERAKPVRRAKAKQLPLEVEGETIRKPATPAERAAAEHQRVEAKVTEAIDLAMQDADVVARVERETRAGMQRDLEDLARSRTGQKGLAAERKLFESGDMNNPDYANWYNSHRAVAIERLKGEFRRQVKGGLDPAEMLRAKLVDAEERAAIQAEGEPVAAEPGVTTPPTPPRTPPSEPGVAGEPPVAAPAGEAPTAPPAAPAPAPPTVPPRAPVPPKPTTPEAGGKVDAGAMLDVVLAKLTKTPEERAYVESHPDLMSRIEARWKEIGDRVEKEGQTGGLTEKQARDAMFGVVRGLLKERGAGKVELPEGVSAAEAGEAGLTVAKGEKGHAATVRESTAGPGGKSRRAQAREAEEVGANLTERGQKWQHIRNVKKEHGLTVPDILEPHVGEYLGKSPGGKKKLSKDSAARFTEYVQQTDALVAGGMKRKAAMQQAAEATRGDLGYRSWVNEIGWIESHLVEKHFDEVAKGAGLRPEALGKTGETPAARAARNIEEFEALDREAKTIVDDVEFDATTPENTAKIAALLNRFVALHPPGLGKGALAERYRVAEQNLRQLGRQLFPDLKVFKPESRASLGKIAEVMANQLGVKLEVSPRVAVGKRPTKPAEVKPSPGFEAGADWRAGRIAKGPGGGRVRFAPHPTDPTRLMAEVLETKSVEGLRQDVAALVDDPNVGDIVLGPKPEGVKWGEWNKGLDQLREEQGLVPVDPAEIAELKAKGKLKKSVEDDEVLRVDRSAKSSALEARDERAGRPDGRLSGRELRSRESEYDRQEKDAGDVVDHDGYFGVVYAARVNRVLGKAIGGIRKVFDELVAEIAPKTKVRFAGITTSPYLRGLFREERGQRARVYANVMEAVANAKNYDEAVDGLGYALAHEVAHLAGESHDSIHFANLNEYLQNLVKAEDWHAKAVKTLKESGFTEDVYEQVRTQLADEFVQARKEINARRRGEGEAAVEGVPARNAQGRAATQPDLAAGGAEAAPGGAAGRGRPGEAVPGGGGGQAGDVRPGTPDSDRVARRLADGEAAGPYARRGEGAVENVIAALEARDPTSYEQALDTLDRAVKSKALEVDELHSFAMKLAKQLSDVATDAEIKDLLNRAPEPRGRVTKQGPVDWGPINMLREFPNMSDRSKARAQIYGLLLADAGVPASGKPRPWTKVNQEALDLVGSRVDSETIKMLAHKTGLTDTETVALQMIHDEYIRDTDRLYERFRTEAAKGTPEAEAKAYEEYRVAADNEALAIKLLIEKKAGVGRALAVMRQEGLEMDPKARFNTSLRAWVDDRLRFHLKDKTLRDIKVEEMMKLWEEQRNAGAPLQEFFRAMDLATGRTGWKGIGYKMLEFWKAGLLGWPSEFANISSNALFRGSRFLEDTLAAGLDAGMFKLGLTKERSVWLGETKVAAMALRRALVEGLNPLLESQARLFRLEGGDMAQMLEGGAMIQDLMMGGGGAIQGKKGNFVRFHFGMMQNFDTYFKLLSKYDTLYREVYRGLRKGEGWLKKMERPGEKIDEAVERIVGELQTNRDRWSKGQQHNGPMLFHSKRMFELAKNVADRDTFQKELGKKGRAAQSFFTEHPGSQLFVPFFRTPTNILKEALKRTPLGFFDVAKNWKKLELESGQAAQMSELAKPVLGTSVMGLFAMLASTGEITGGGPLSFEEREALQATGWQPYSVRIGDQWISYQRFEPIASILGMAADMMEAYREGDMDSYASIAQKVSDSVAENLTNKTFLSGLSTLTGAISDPKRELGTFAKQMAGSAVPNSIGFVPFGHLARAIDPVYREAEPFSKEVVLAKIPFVSTKLDPAYGPTGEPRTRPGGFVERLISPVARRTVQSGPHARGSEEIVRLQAVPKAPIRYWTSPQGFRVPLKPEERQRVAKALQDAVTEIGQRIVKDPWYQGLPKDEMDPNYQYGQKTKQKVLEGVINRYRSRVMKQIMPALRQRSRQAYEEREL